MTARTPVGVVGIGLLGQAFARRLLGAGFDVIGFDVDPAKNAKLADLGGRPATSVADLARRCDPIVLAVFSTDQVEAVIESELLPALGNGLRDTLSTRFKRAFWEWLIYSHLADLPVRGLGARHRGCSRRARPFVIQSPLSLTVKRSYAYDGYDCRRVVNATFRSRCQGAANGTLGVERLRDDPGAARPYLEQAAAGGIADALFDLAIVEARDW